MENGPLEFTYKITFRERKKGIASIGDIYFLLDHKLLGTLRS